MRGSGLIKEYFGNSWPKSINLFIYKAKFDCFAAVLKKLPFSEKKKLEIKGVRHVTTYATITR